MAAIKRVMDEVMEPPSFDAGADTGEPLAREAAVLAAVKKMALFAAGVASQRFMTALAGRAGSDGRPRRQHQPDLCPRVGTAARPKAGRSQQEFCPAAAAMTGLLADETMALAEQAARRVLAACGEGDMLRTQLAILRQLARFTPANTVSLSRTVANAALAVERYPF